jgi:hypothetical protein
MTAPAARQVAAQADHGGACVTSIIFVAALYHNTAPMVVDGGINGEMFLAYTDQCLVPKLQLAISR